MTHLQFLPAASQPAARAACEARPHPTRTQPACKNCRHGLQWHEHGALMCDHPAQPVDRVTGAPQVPCAIARHDANGCRDKGYVFCGHGATHFEVLRTFPVIDDAAGDGALGAEATPGAGWDNPGLTD